MRKTCNRNSPSFVNISVFNLLETYKLTWMLIWYICNASFPTVWVEMTGWKTWKDWFFRILLIKDAFFLYFLIENKITKMHAPCLQYLEENADKKQIDKLPK